MRTFIAIDLEPEIKCSLTNLLSDLKKTGDKIKWAKKQSMHLTLKFLGEISRDKMTEIESVLERLSNKFSSFQLILKGTGTFPPKSKKPRILWIGIEECSRLNDFQSELETSLEKVGFPIENRKFRPHLTLGRVKKPENLDSLLSLYDRHKESDFGEMVVNKITFFKSILKPEGAEYHILSEFDLK